LSVSLRKTARDNKSLQRATYETNNPNPGEQGGNTQSNGRNPVFFAS